MRFFLIVLVASFTCCGVARAEPEQARWNLADLYASQADWDADATRLTAQLDRFASCKGRLGSSVARFKSCLDLLDDLQKRQGRLDVYASETHNQDTSDAAGLALQQRSQILESKLTEATSFLRPEVLAMGRKKIDGFLARDRSLDRYRHGLDSILRQAPHTLDAAGEGIVARFALTGDDADSTYTLLATSDLPWPMVTLSDGKTIRLDQSAYTKYRAVQNRADRKLVMDAFFGAMKKFEATFGATLYSALKTDSVNAKVHRYPDTITAALGRNAVPVDVYDTLIRECNASLDTLHRYFRLRAKLLGASDLHYYDVYPPLVKADVKYSLADAERLTLESVAPLGPDYVAAMKHGFESRWMDAYPRPHKLSGAHMNPGAYDVHPYVLANFNDDFESVTTVAHEWGHAMHTVLAEKAQPFTTANYPIFVAEIASTFDEAMLSKHMLEIARSDDEKLLVLGSALETLRTTFYRQAMFAEFERAIHAKVDAGESLSGADFTTLYGDILRKYHGDAQGVVRIDDVDTIEWAYIPHFYSAFYVFQYATSIAASSLFADEVLAGRPGAKERYLGMLSAGGSGYPYDLVKRAGVDLASPAPYRSIVARMNGIMDEIEAIEARRLGRP